MPNHSLQAAPLDSLRSLPETALPETSSGQARQAGPLSSTVRIYQ